MKQDEYEKYKNKIMKFSKEVIIDAAIFAMNPEKVYQKCVYYEITKIRRKIDDLDIEINKLCEKRKSISDVIEINKSYIEVSGLRDKQFALYDKINKLLED